MANFVLVVLTCCAFFFMTKIMKKTGIFEMLLQYAAIVGVVGALALLFAPSIMGILLVSGGVILAALITSLQIYLVYKLAEVVILGIVAKKRGK